MILSLGALRWGVSRGRNDGSSKGRCGGHSGHGVNVGALFAVTLFGRALKTWTILNRVIWVSTIHAEFVGDAAFSFFLR